MRVALAALLVIGFAAPLCAEPMKCSAQYKPCLTECKNDHSCMQSCAVRLSQCTKTGCWQGSNFRACGLAKQ
jgi:hypothetical protein